uniref:Putative secreted protein n=1 Tax=Anopheles marajoara TaxID=58244 RepID=A0A2M4C9K8_9DIPT
MGSPSRHPRRSSTVVMVLPGAPAAMVWRLCGSTERTCLPRITRPSWRVSMCCARTNRSCWRRWPIVSDITRHRTIVRRTVRWKSWKCGTRWSIRSPS